MLLCMYNSNLFAIFLLSSCQTTNLGEMRGFHLVIWVKVYPYPVGSHFFSYLLLHILFKCLFRWTLAVTFLHCTSVLLLNIKQGNPGYITIYPGFPFANGSLLIVLVENGRCQSHNGVSLLAVCKLEV